MPYEIKHSDSWTQEVDGAFLVAGYVSRRERFGDSPGIEKQIERLSDIIGRIADAAGVNLLEIIKPDEIRDHRLMTHVQAPEPDDGKDRDQLY